MEERYHHAPLDGLSSIGDSPPIFMTTTHKKFKKDLHRRKNYGIIFRLEYFIRIMTKRKAKHKQ